MRANLKAKTRQYQSVKSDSQGGSGPKKDQKASTTKKDESQMMMANSSEAGNAAEDDENEQWLNEYGVESSAYSAKSHQNPEKRQATKLDDQRTNVKAAKDQ